MSSENLSLIGKNQDLNAQTEKLASELSLMHQKNISDHEQLENKISLLQEENTDLKEVLSKNDKKMPLMIESQLSRLCNVFQNFGETIEKS